MAISFLFKIGTTDLTGNIVQNTYAVNNLPVYKEYKDANEQTHRRFLRNKVSGTFEMVFDDMTDFATFQSLVESNRSATTHSVACTVYDNISGTTMSINAFLDYRLTAKQALDLKEYYQPFEVTIEEC